MADAAKKGNTTYYLNVLVGVVIMFLGWFIPEGIIPDLTATGLQVVGVFIGTIYLWATIDPLAASIISMFMLAMTDYTTSSGLLVAAFGNSTLIQIFFIMILSAAITNRKVTDYIAYWIMSRKFIVGRPWIFTVVVLLGVYVISSLMDSIAVILIFWPIMKATCKAIGYEKNEAYPMIMTFAIVIVALFGFPVAPYRTAPLGLLGNLRSLIEGYPALLAFEGSTINDGLFFMFTFPIGLLLTLVTVFIIRFIFRPDVEKLKGFTTDILKENELPPMNTAQKWMLGGLFAFIGLMLIPSLLQNLPVLSFLYSNNIAIVVALVGFLCLVRTPQGHPIECGKVMVDPDFPWGTYFMICSALVLGSAMTDESTGVTAFLATILSPLISGMTPVIFTVFILVVCYVLTNFCNSLVMGILLEPIVLTYCSMADVNPAPITVILIFTVLCSAACTPAASPFAAMLFGSPDLNSAYVYKHAIPFTLINLAVIMLVGIPYVNLLF